MKYRLINKEINLNNMEDNLENNEINDEEEEDEEGEYLIYEGDDDAVLSQMSNISERTKSLLKRTMDEYPPGDEDTLFEQNMNN